MTKTWCPGGRHYSNTNNIAQNEKKNPSTKKPVEVTKDVVFAVVINLRFLLSK